MSEKVSLDLLHGILPASIDLFICSTSFEGRSLSIVKSIQNDSVKRVIVFTDPEASPCSTATEMAKWITSAFGSRAFIIPFRVKDPLNVADTIIGAIVQAQARANVFIDVTTFTQESLLILLKALQLACPGVAIKGLYNSATDYGLGQTGDRKWLTKGVSELRSVLGYAGTSRPTLGQHLIVLAGFELERAEKTIDLYDPNLLSVGLGDPLESISHDLFDVNKLFHQKLVERYGGVKQFYFSCDDPIHARDALLKHVLETPGYNVCVAPMNTKISTVGVGLAAMADNSIQICYANPALYNLDGYSKASSNAYIFDINFPPPAQNAV